MFLAFVVMPAKLLFVRVIYMYSIFDSVRFYIYQIKMSSSFFMLKNFIDHFYPLQI